MGKNNFRKAVFYSQNHMKGEGAMADIGHDALFLTAKYPAKCTRDAFHQLSLDKTLLLRFSQRSHFNASFHIRSYL